VRKEVSATDSARPIPFSFVVGLFVVSGAIGLFDQLCFSKYLGYIVGSTAHAVSAVLAAFMAGLAIGAHFGGKYAKRIQRPLLAYGVLEIVVAVAVALAPTLFHALTPLYVSLARSMPNSLVAISALRWGLAMLVVIIPTTAMGATLPFLSRALGERAAAGPEEVRRRERRLGILYAANTLGGGLGALGAAYLVLPAFGLAHTVIGAAIGSALIGVVSIVLGRRSGSSFESESDTDESAEPEDRASLTVAREPEKAEALLLVGLAFASGWLVFASEVVFTHLLALIIGNSAYAFGLILAVFLSCLFVGASRAPWFARRFGDSGLSISLALTGIALVTMLPVWDRLPLLFAGTGKVITSFAGREATRAAVAFVLLALPVSLMGLTFPLLLGRVARYASVSTWVGRLTAVNTIGAVVGSLVTGYVALPALGSQRMLAVSAIVFAALAVATSLVQFSGNRRSWAIAGLLYAGVFAAVTPRWDLGQLTNGANVYFDTDKPPDEILMMEEDVHGGVTTVVRRGDVHTLYTNGKFQGNTGWEMNAQRFFAHYPQLFVRDFDKALVVGLGTGTTLGAITGYPWQRIDVVEISPAIERAARTHFQGVNRRSLEDSRVRVHIGDGRNFLLLGDEKYRMISMELSSIWFAGAASLYSREFYEVAHRRLEPGGIFQQWVQLHHVTRRDFATILHTLALEFPHVILFYGGGQGILVASDRPLQASLSRLERNQGSPEINATIPENRPLSALFDDVLVMDKGLWHFLNDAAKAEKMPLDDMISSDENLYLEYATPRGNVLPWHAREELVAKLRNYHDPEAIRTLVVP
jgi:spermidine synthase